LDTVLEYLGGSHGDPKINSWLIVSPQLATSGKEKAHENKPWQACGFDFGVRKRGLALGENRYKVYSEPEHIDAASFLAGLVEGDRLNQWTAQLKEERQAVMLFYPVLAAEEKCRIPTMGFVLLFPTNSISAKVRWKVRRPQQADQVTVPLVSVRHRRK